MVWVRQRRLARVAMAITLALGACSGSAVSGPDGPDGDPPGESRSEIDGRAGSDGPSGADERTGTADPEMADEQHTGPQDPSPGSVPSSQSSDGDHGSEVSEGRGPPPLPPGRAALVARTQSLVDAAVRAADDVTLAVVVTDEHGRDIAHHHADAPLLPASTMKVVTAAAILMTLGPDGNFTTRVESTAPIAGDGTLRGDLILTGGGDPVLATDEYARWVYPARPVTRLSSLADDLVASGLQRLDGDVVGVAPGFTGSARAEGWPDRYFSDFDARYASGLTVDAGLRTILSYPEPEPDDDGDGSDDGPPEATAGSDGAPDAADGSDADAEDEAEDLGPPIVRVDHVTEPGRHAAVELRRLLQERDVEVTGEARVDDAGSPTVGRLAAVQSPSMHELLRFAVTRSDNHLADGMFQAIGRVRTGEGSWLRGDRAVRQVLDRLQIDHQGAVFADGSGLSRDDRLTARLLVELDRRMSAGPHASTWTSLMAVMGETGTLRERLTGTVAAGRFRGKTGTLRDVTALSGAAVGADGTRYHLAVIANDATWPGRGVARQLMDELALQLSAEVAGCQVSMPEPDPDATDQDGNGASAGPPPLPRSEIAC